VWALILANVVWDFVSALAIALDYAPIARWHLVLWIDDTAVGRLCMFWMVVMFGVARLAVVLAPRQYFMVGFISYLLETWFAEMAIAEGLMRPHEGRVVSVLSLGCACAMLSS
jgi:hypothetical protein